MAKHFNPSISQDARRILNTKTADVVSSQIGELLVATIPIERPNTFVDSTGVVTATGNASAHNSVTGKDTYITGVNIAYMKNAANDNTSISLLMKII